MMTTSLTRTPDDAVFRQLCQMVEQGMGREAIPGVVLGVMHGERQFVAAFGVTSVENPLPVTADTLFQVGSITKTFTATALMRLVEAGQLALDVPLRTWLPNLQLADPDVAERVTLRHLLTHTGGWVGDYFNDYGPDSRALERILADLPQLAQLTPLGEVWSYNNAGFYIAGRLIEVVTGQSYEQAMHTLLLDPLQLKRSFFFPHEIITERFVVGHEVADQRPRVARPWWIGRAGHAIGGLVSCVGDLFEYARFHMGDGAAGDGQRLLSPPSLRLMQTPQVAAGGRDWMGLSWFITPLAGEQVLRHGGATHGQMAHLTLVPSRRFAYIMLTNSDEAEQLIYGVRKAALREYLGLRLPEAVPVPTPLDKLAEYAGRYEAAAQSCDLRLEGEHLRLHITPKGGFPTPDSPPGQPPPPMRIALYAEDRAVVLDGPSQEALIEFLRHPDGSLAWMRLGGRIHQRVSRGAEQAGAPS